MYIAYFYWQFIAAPAWLVRLIVNLERALVIFFSVPTMAKTLLAHWHRDAVSTRRGTISAIAMAYAWNAISRGIGLIIRLAMIVTWALAAVMLAGVGCALLLVFVLWPLLVLVGFAAGLVLLQLHALPF